jgi:hypothetical protein
MRRVAQNLVLDGQVIRQANLVFLEHTHCTELDLPELDLTGSFSQR